MEEKAEIQEKEEALEEEPEERPRLSVWWWFALGVSFFLTALISRLLGLVAGIFCALIALVNLINLGRPLRKLRRIVYVIIVPGVLTTVIVASVLNQILRTAEIADAISATSLRFIASGPKAIAFWPVVIGLIAGFIAPLLTIYAYVLLNIDQLTSFTGLEAKEARRVLISILLNVDYPYMVIKDGEEKETKPQGILPRLGGPGLVVIHPNSAVIFERDDKPTRVELGGFVTTERFERPGKIIDLRPQSANALVANVLTKDGVPLNFEMGFFYQIRRQGEQTLSEPYPVQKRDVFKAAYNVNNWKADTEFLGCNILRDVVAELNLDEVYEFDPITGKPIARANIRKEVMDRLNKMTLTWGTEVTWVDIGKIEMPENAREQLLERWMSKAKAETLQVIETAKARAESQMIAAVADALKAAGASGPTLERLLEKWWMSKAKSDIAQPESLYQGGFNPYICGGPITEPDMFFGREDLLTKMLNTLHHNHLAIYGERRMGKTSILHQLAHRLRESKDAQYFFVPVFVNLQWITEDKLFYALMSSIAKSCQAYVGPLDSSSTVKREDYDDFEFEQDLETALEILKKITGKEVRLVLLLDEGDTLNKYDNRTQARLRSIFMTPAGQHLKMVWVGVHLDKSWKLDTSPWYNLFAEEMRLGPLSEEEALDLIKSPIKGVYQYDDEAIERILVYSGHKPFEIQKICMHAINRILEDKRRKVTAEDVEYAYRNIISGE